jgi:uncharacterized protein
MIERIAKFAIKTRLEYFPAVAVIGPRQVGKTTLVKSILDEMNEKEVEYLDLEFAEDAKKMLDPSIYLKRIEHKTVILDEVQRLPELFPTLRSLIDQHNIPARFILLGSATPELLKNTSETLAGRISYYELMPFCYEEIKPNYEQLWLRGGFPKAYLAPNSEFWNIWFESFYRTYVERDLPLLGMPANPIESQRLLQMISALQGNLLNYFMLSNSLGISNVTVKKYINFLEHAFLVKRLHPFYINIGKRLTKSPKIYIRDSGFLHYLLGISKVEDIFGHYLAGASWEGFVLQQIISYLPINTQIYFYRTSDGAELDFVIVKGINVVLAIEAKLSNAPNLTKGTTIALQDVGNPPLLIVTPSADDYPMANNRFVCSVKTLKENMDRYL